jgi:hypothetical protein
MGHSAHACTGTAKDGRDHRSIQLTGRCIWSEATLLLCVSVLVERERERERERDVERERARAQADHNARPRPLVFTK